MDSTQAVTSTLTPEAFGNTVAQWGSSANPYRFAGAWGYRDDGDAGLLHVGARYYDPQVGRFISRDAVLSEHPYLYCEHEPVMRVDPSGDRPFKDYWDVFWSGVGAGIGADIGGSVAGPPGMWIGGGIGGSAGLWIGDQIWEGGEQLYDVVRDAWNNLRGKLEKLKAYGAMLDELGL